ncbi:MAG: phage tail protein [Oscillospiraceae bacterium]|nr:phage tail protein [Oscillospiraceae bacterium]
MAGDAITLNIDTDGGIEEAVQALRSVSGGADKAIARAFNKTAGYMKDTAANEVPNVFTVSGKSVKAGMKIRKAKTSSLSAEISRSGPPLYARKFSFDANTSPGIRGGSAVFLRERHSGGRHLDSIGGKSKAFVVGRGLVMRRPTSARLPIIHAEGISVPEMLSEPNVRSVIQERGAARLTQELDREIQALLKN